LGQYLWVPSQCEYSQWRCAQNPACLGAYVVGPIGLWVPSILWVPSGFPPSVAPGRAGRNWHCIHMNTVDLVTVAPVRAGRKCKKPVRCRFLAKYGSHPGEEVCMEDWMCFETMLRDVFQQPGAYPYPFGSAPLGWLYGVSDVLA
jgi:hypothetical protein